MAGAGCAVLAQAQPPSSSSSTSTTRLKRGTGLLVMAHDPQRVLQAICQPAQLTAPACMLPMGWQNPPGSTNYRAAGATSLGSWVQGSRVCGPAGKQSSPPYGEQGKAHWALPACFAHPWHKERHPKKPAVGDWRAIDPHSIQTAQHQPFPARFFSALWNILDCFLLLLCTLSTTCWFLFPSACQSDEGTARSDSSMSLCHNHPTPQPKGGCVQDYIPALEFSVGNHL